MPPADEQFLDALYAEFGPALYRFAYRWLKDRGRAEDVVQEVLLRAWRHPEVFVPGAGSPQAWLFRTTRNLLTDYWRADQSRPRVVADEQVVADEPGEDEFEPLVDAWQVEAALAELPPHQRSVLVETFFRDRSVAEAARVLGIPAGTVKSRTHYALRALRVLLEQRGVTS